MAWICSQCTQTIKAGKGTTVHYYRGRKEESYECCSTPCIDTLKGKMAAQGFGIRPIAERRGYGRSWTEAIRKHMAENPAGAGE